MFRLDESYQYSIKFNVDYLAGPNPNQGVVITRDRANAADIWRMGVNNTWFLVRLSVHFCLITKQFFKQF